MGQEVRLFESEERMTRSDVAAFVRQVADKIESGHVVLRQGEQEITLDLPAHATLEVEVEDEDKGARGIEHSLELEITWFDDDPDGPLEVG